MMLPPAVVVEHWNMMPVCIALQVQGSGGAGSAGLTQRLAGAPGTPQCVP